jgi:hypothetical protein
MYRMNRVRTVAIQAGDRKLTPSAISLEAPGSFAPVAGVVSLFAAANLAIANTGHGASASQMTLDVARAVGSYSDRHIAESYEQASDQEKLLHGYPPFSKEN